MEWYKDLGNTSPPIDDFPVIDSQKVTDWANQLFEPYLFRESRKNNIWLGCSACGKSSSSPRRTISSAEYEALTTAHNQHARCPWCGRLAWIKETRYLRKRKSLEQYIPIMILTAKAGALYGRGYWARKDYQGPLLAKPFFMGTYAYYWGPGISTAYDMYSGRIVKNIAGPSYGPKNYLPKPHISGSWCYSTAEPCYVYGAEELEKTRLRYIKSPEFIPSPCTQKTYPRLVDSLTLANAYPVATEILMRQGPDILIWDMLNHYRKNAELINWAANNPKQLLRNVSYSEFASVSPQGRLGIDMLSKYIKFRKAGRPERLDKIKEMYLENGIGYGDGVCEFAFKAGISLTKADNYICRQQAAADKKSLSKVTLLGFWKDALKIAASLGYNTADSAVRFPKNLVAAHDKYAEQERERLKEIAAAEARERELAAAERLDKWAAKYEIEAQGYRIILPRSEKEIQAEGAALRHCVAGYAARHIKGKLTILFLRRSQEPDVSLYTIEMHGNNLVQIHGYRNDIGKASPRETMSWLIEPWLKWLKAGSPRDKQGRAKIQIDRKEFSKAV